MSTKSTEIMAQQLWTFSVHGWETATETD